MPLEAPAAPPPAEPAAPAQTGQRAQLGNMADSDAFSSLDAMLEPAAPAPAPGKAPADIKVAEPDDDAPEAPPKPEAKPAEKPADKVIPPKDPKDGKFLKAATLRENYDRLKGEFKALQEKHAKIEADAAERAKQPNGEAHMKELQTKYEALQKQHEAREQEMRFLSYEKSEEYKEKYEKPFVEAYQTGREIASSLRIVERKNDVDEVIQASRPATAADFDAIMQSSDPTGTIEQLFGTGVNAADVNNARRDVIKANTARNKALEEYRKQGGEREKQHTEAANRQKAQSAELYHQTIAASKAQYKDWFAPAENDAQGNSLLEQGEALADLAHGVLKPEDFGKLPAKTQEKLKKGEFTPQDMIRLHAAIRNKAMGFDRLVMRDRQKAARIKELEAQLAEYSASEPKPGTGGGRPEAPPADDMESTLASMDRLVS